MKMINLSKNKFDSLSDVELSKNTFHTEGQIFEMKYNRFQL